MSDIKPNAPNSISVGAPILTSLLGELTALLQILQLDFKNLTFIKIEGNGRLREEKGGKEVETRV